ISRYFRTPNPATRRGRLRSLLNSFSFMVHKYFCDCWNGTYETCAAPVGCYWKTSRTLSTIITAAVLHATQLKNLEFTYLPIRLVLLISKSMNTSTKGSRTPLKTCESTGILSSGNLGSRITAAPAPTSPVYSQ